MGANPFQPGGNPFQGANPFQGPPTNPFQIIGGANGNNSSNNNTTPPLFVPPWPPFPFMPFIAPPPVPPINLRALSEEELRQMEGNERKNIEARIQCLKNIQVIFVSKNTSKIEK